VVLVNIVVALERDSLQDVKWDGEVVARGGAAASSAVLTADEAPEAGLPLRIELLEYFYYQLFEQHPSMLRLFVGADVQQRQGSCFRRSRLSLLRCGRLMRWYRTCRSSVASTWRTVRSLRTRTRWARRCWNRWRRSRVTSGRTSCRGHGLRRRARSHR
jgi:hypothetical protein